MPTVDQPRLLIRRLLLLATGRFRKRTPNTAAAAAATRAFTRNIDFGSSCRTRPQLPFLAVPLSRNHVQYRYLTTERKRWLAYEVYLGLKYTLYIWAALGCLAFSYWAVHQEYLEQRYPSPHEWGFFTRLKFRLMKWWPDRTEVMPSWVTIGVHAMNLLLRLEDPDYEGAGLREVAESDGRAMRGGVEHRVYDITAKPEPWRRGYYDVLTMCAQAAEKLDGDLIDMHRRLVFPAEMVPGPSNPDPRPIPPGWASAPHEKDCQPFFEPASTFYTKILATNGFSARQRLDAALAYASWLDHKQDTEASEAMYELALKLASERSDRTELPFCEKTYVLKGGTGQPPSENMLRTLTEYATHKARHGDVSSALPILVSVLRARRSSPLPQGSRPEASVDDHAEGPSASAWSYTKMWSRAKDLMGNPVLAPAPDDGEAPPVRDAKGLCEEAALNLYIGEIIYASKGSPSAREDGLAWTREAVDIAEEQLHRLDPDSARDAAAKVVCRQCLATGLSNWAEMTARLAQEEREKEKLPSDQQQTSSWLGLWGEAKPEVTGRWTAEEKVVEERKRRAQEILEELHKPSAGISSIFWA